MSLLSYTSKTKTDFIWKNIWSIKKQKIELLWALSKFLVLLAIFLLENLGDAFINLSSAAGNLAQENHLIQFVESISKPTIEPSSEPACKLTNDQMND